MALQGTASLRGPLANLKVRTLALEQKLAASLWAKSSPSLPSRIAVIGNYLPRQCGIATFTTDLCDAIGAEFGAAQLLAVPVNDAESRYNYPPRVRFELTEGDLASYQDAADFLNFSNVDLVCLQFEYGIFGGPDTVPADRKRWTTVLGEFRYPCWIDKGGQGWFQPMDRPALHFEGPALIYPLSRVPATGLDDFTVIDILRDTLGVGPCEYVLDVEGQQSQYKPLHIVKVGFVEDAPSRSGSCREPCLKSTFGGFHPDCGTAA